MKHSILGAACASILIMASGAAHASSISGQGTWETTLQGRDLDGNLSTFEAYYDTVLDITWLADANYAQTSGYDADGLMGYYAANNWAAQLNPYGSGITGWRLPSAGGQVFYGTNEASNGTSLIGYNYSAPGTLYSGQTNSKMAYMFYNTLGDKGYCNPTTSTASTCSGPQSGWGLSNTGPFSNLQASSYWSQDKFATYIGDTCYYYNNVFQGCFPNYDYNDGVRMNFGYGRQTKLIDTAELYAWAVHGGDVGFVATTSTVPVPTAAWLFGSGLLGLIGIARRKKAA